MKPIQTALCAAMLACGALSGAAFAQSMPEFKFSGFGTLAAAHADDKNADFKGSLFQPKGAGHSRRTSFDPDTVLGGQLGVVFNDKLSAVVQVISQYQYDNSYTPQVEWANVKYQVTPELSVRLGRIAAPSYLLSETRFVGYANPWVRPPAEAYSVLSITSNDGIDLSYRGKLFGANNAFQVYYGKSRADLSTNSDIKAKPAWGFNDTVELGALTLRAGYTSAQLDANIPSLAGLFSGLQGLSAGLAQVPAPAFQTASAQALGLVDKYRTDDIKVGAISLGANYDPGNWFVMGEFIGFKGERLLSDMDAWYLSGGYRFGSFTPYVTYSSVKSHIKAEAGITTAGLEGVPALAGGAAGLNAAINSTLLAFTPTQNTVTVGLRWDFMANVAAKLQYDHIKTGSQSNGRLATYPGFVQGSSLNVVTAGLSFVF